MGSDCIKTIHSAVCRIPFLSSANLCAVARYSIEQYGAVLSCAVPYSAVLCRVELCCATAVCSLQRQLHRMPPKTIVRERPVYAPQQPSFCADHQNCVMHDVAGFSGRRQAEWSSDIRLLALDMDGTLLDTNSKVLPSSIKAIKVKCCLPQSKPSRSGCTSCCQVFPANMSQHCCVCLAVPQPRGWPFTADTSICCMLCSASNTYVSQQRCQQSYARAGRFECI